MIGGTIVETVRFSGRAAEIIADDEHCSPGSCNVGGACGRRGALRLLRGRQGAPRLTA